MAKEDQQEKLMSIVDHLDDFRRRLIICIATVLVLSIASYAFVETIREVFIRSVGKLVYLSLAEAFFANMRLAFMCGFFLSLPVIFFQIWGFVLPGLYKHERFAIIVISVLTLFFFFLGMSFAFLVVLPFSTIFFLGFAGEGLEAMISFSSYLSYAASLMIGFGLAFELPVAVMILARLGIVTSGFLAAKRSFAVVIIFFLAAVLTPPDVVSQILMGVPMLLLYELSIFLAWIAGRKGKEAH